ncbi:MAG TPA: type II secretion system F family protein [Phycisphaerae bacterium]|jgi:tight adherence protein C
MPPIAIIAGLIGVSIMLIIYALWPKGANMQDVIRRRMSGRKTTEENTLLKQTGKESVAKKMMQAVAPLAMKPVMPKSDLEVSKLRIKLANAGFRGESAPMIFLASKTILAIGLGIVGLIYGWTRGDEAQKIAGIGLFCTALGFMGPNMWLNMAAGKRAEQVRNGLPDSLDLLVISVESGLALDAAIQRVGDEMRHVHPIVSEEFQIATLETQMGIPRAEALNNVATRTGVSEMRSLVAIVNQAEKFGTSVARALRSQADALRVKRRQKAEERAQKTTVKLMAPLILFIFPAIFVVLAGPAALKLIDTLGSTGLGKK